MFKFLTDCTRQEVKAEDIHDMQDNAREIHWELFAERVSLPELEAMFPLSFRTGPHLKDDYAVRFYRSTFRGRLCYFMEHSCIEYIFVEEK